jgi:hypothetical protein
MNGSRILSTGRGTPRGRWKLPTLTLLAGLALILGPARAIAVPGSGEVVDRLGNISVQVSALRVGPSGALTGSVQISTTGQSSDQLDAAIAEGGAPVALYHPQVSVGEISDIAGCDGGKPSPGIVDHWLHYGPLLVPGRSSGLSPPAEATLTIWPVRSVRAGGSLPVTFYFAVAGSVTVRPPIVLP